MIRAVMEKPELMELCPAKLCSGSPWFHVGFSFQVAEFPENCAFIHSGSRLGLAFLAVRASTWSSFKAGGQLLDIRLELQVSIPKARKGQKFHGCDSLLWLEFSSSSPIFPTEATKSQLSASCHKAEYQWAPENGRQESWCHHYHGTLDKSLSLSGPQLPDILPSHSQPSVGGGPFIWAMVDSEASLRSST